MGRRVVLRAKRWYFDDNGGTPAWCVSDDDSKVPYIRLGLVHDCRPLCYAADQGRGIRERASQPYTIGGQAGPEQYEPASQPEAWAREGSTSDPGIMR